MKTLYYCVGGVWMARACGEDHTALEDLARLENKEPFGGTLKPDHRELSISLFADPARAQYYVIAEFGTLDGLSCN